MKDVLETLKKLPPMCAAELNGDVGIIKRGAGFSTHPLILNSHHVEIFNKQNGVLPEQAQAMIVGATLGWDKDGADPDTHKEVHNSNLGPFTYEFDVTFFGGFRVTARSVAEAKQKVEVAVEAFEEAAQEWVEGDTAIISFCEPGDHWDLVNTDDPAA